MAFVTKDEINNSNPSQKDFPGQTVEVRIRPNLVTRSFDGHRFEPM